MTPEIEGYLDQLASINQDVPGLVAGLTHDQFNWRPSPDRWSIAQCLDHLNLTAARFIPAIDGALADAGRRNLHSQGPFTYPLLERWFTQSQEPPPRMRSGTFKTLKPPVSLQPQDVLTRFSGWQDQFEQRLRQADGVDLQRARHRSPVLPLVKWRLGTMFALTMAHERRHLWQAREVRNHPGFPAM
jgi:DinB superfamily